MANVALGLRAHSGWAALVAVAEPLRSPSVIERGRIELADVRVPRPFQPYHAAAVMPFKKAEEFIRHTTEQTRRAARQSLATVVAGLREKGFEVAGCGTLLGLGRPLGKLEKILAAHPLIHTAEGELFRSALAHAAGRLKLPVTRIKERELFARAEETLKIPGSKLQKRLAEFGRAIGPPWRQDQKFAMVAAWLALASI
jgi:hypothetical protein